MSEDDLDREPVEEERASEEETARDVRSDVDAWTAGDPPRKRAPKKKKPAAAAPAKKKKTPPKEPAEAASAPTEDPETMLLAIDSSLRTLAEAITPPEPPPEPPSPEPIVEETVAVAAATVVEKTPVQPLEELPVMDDEPTTQIIPEIPEPAVLEPAPPPLEEEPLPQPEPEVHPQADWLSAGVADAVQEAPRPPEPPPFEEPPIEAFVFAANREQVAAASQPSSPPGEEPEQPQRRRRGRARNLKQKRFDGLSTFADALIPRGGLLGPGASDVGVAERVDASLERLDPAVRKRMEQLVTLMDLAPMFTRLKRMGSMSQSQASAWLARAYKSSNPLVRQAYAFLKLICLNEYASTPQVEEAIGFTYSCETKDPPRDGPPLEVISYPAIDRDHIEECDAVVIGSGAGGATIAKELAEGGLSVIVVEEGGYFTRSDFAGPPWERVQRFYRANGTTVALGKPVIPMPMGKAVGGTTLVNSGTCFRTPDRVLERWSSEFGIDGLDPSSMRPIFDRVEKLMHVKPVPEELLGNNARVFRRGVESLGLNGAPILRNIQGCRGCGVCAFGCPSDAKQATHISYLPRAQRAGATIFARCRVSRLVVEEGRAAGVIADVNDARGEKKATLTIRSKIVVLAAGAVHTPALLQANALANRSGQVGHNLRIHPAAGVGAFFEEDIYSWRGTLQPYFVDNWHASQEVMIEVTSSVPSIAAGSFPGMGLELKHLLGRFRNLASAGLFVSDTSSGRVRRRRSGEPLVTYRLNQPDTRKLVRGVITLAEIFFAAGAKQIFLGLPRTPVVTHPNQLESIKEEAVKPGGLKLTAFHPAGTARMGRDPATTVVDSWGECHDVAGLFITDASMLPGCPTVNPQITIMAFATRSAQHILRAKSSYFS